MKPLLALLASSLVGAFAADDTQKLTQTMHNHFHALMKLQPYAASTDSFADDANRQKIEEQLKVLKDSASKLPELAVEKNASMKPIAQTFSEYVGQVEHNFRAGHHEFARKQLRSASSFCIACHTRSQLVKPFTDFENLVVKAPLTPLDRAELFVATRQFDKALDAYNKIFSEEPKSERERRDLLHAVRSALSVSVRVKQDPKTSYALVTKLSQIDGVKEMVGSDLRQWQADLAQWNGESKKSEPKSASAYLARAKKLLSRARANQRFPADHASDINYMRALNDLHAALEMDPKAAFRAEVYELLGVTYGVLREPMLLDVNALYFETCIREVPHTARAKGCFRKLSNTVYQGYSGSGGTFIPNDEVERLSRLRKLAN